MARKDIVDPHYTRNYLAFFIIGTLNNFTYVTVNSAAKEIVVYFNEEAYIGAVLWANVISGVFIQFVNALWLEYVSTRLRIAIVIVLFMLGTMGVAFSTHVSFVFLLASVVLVGTATTFGQCVILGFLERFRPETVGGWSSGTGLAGVSGSMTMVLFAYIGLSITQDFLIIAPLIFVYLAVFFLMVKVPGGWAAADVARPHADPVDPEKRKSDERARLVSPSHNDTAINREHVSADGSDLDSGKAAIVPVEGPPGESKLRRFLRCGKLVWWKASNMGAVYFFEYVVSVGCAALVEPKDGYGSDADFFHKNSYVVLAFCYQFGVLVSRSSLKFFKVRRILVLTLLQAANMVFWMLDAQHKWMGVWVQFAAMFYVGLLGGTSYVNTFYLILEDPKIPESDRKLCVYITALAINFGISLAAAFTIFMDATFLSAQVST